MGDGTGDMVSVAEALLLPNVAEMVAVVVVETAVVVTVKLADMEPEETVTCEGTLAAVLLEERATTVPPDPAACERVTVPVEPLPPCSDDGLSVTWDTVVTGAGVTVRAAETPLPLPIEAEMFAVVVVETDWVLTVKFAELEPEATVTCAGTLAAELSEERATTTPPDPVDWDRVTVPVELLPPATEAGFNVTDCTDEVAPGENGTAFDIWLRMEGWPTAFTYSVCAPVLRENCVRSSEWVPDGTLAICVRVFPSVESKTR